MKKLLWLVKADNSEPENDAVQAARSLIGSPEATIVIIYTEVGQEIKDKIISTIGLDNDFEMLAISGGHGTPKQPGVFNEFAGFTGRDIPVVFAALKEAGVKANLVIAATCYSASYATDLKGCLKPEGVILSNTVTAPHKYTDEIKQFAEGGAGPIDVEIGQFAIFNNPAHLNTEEYKELQQMLQNPSVSLAEICKINKIRDYVTLLQAQPTPISREQLLQAVGNEQFSTPIESSSNGVRYSNRHELVCALIEQYRAVTGVEPDEYSDQELLENSIESWSGAGEPLFEHFFGHDTLDLKFGAPLIKLIADTYKDKHVTSTCISTLEDDFTRTVTKDALGHLSPLPFGAAKGQDDSKGYDLSISSLDHLQPIDYYDYTALQSKWDQAAQMIAANTPDDLFTVPDIDLSQLALETPISVPNLATDQQRIKKEVGLLKEKEGAPIPTTSIASKS